MAFARQSCCSGQPETQSWQTNYFLGFLLSPSRYVNVKLLKSTNYTLAFFSVSSQHSISLQCFKFSTCLWSAVLHGHHLRGSSKLTLGFICNVHLLMRADAGGQGRAAVYFGSTYQDGPIISKLLRIYGW